MRWIGQLWTVCELCMLCIGANSCSVSVMFYTKVEQRKDLKFWSDSQSIPNQICAASSHVRRIIQSLPLWFCRPSDPHRAAGLWSFPGALPLSRGKSRQVVPQWHHHGYHQRDGRERQRAGVRTRRLQCGDNGGSDARSPGNEGKRKR